MQMFMTDGSRFHWAARRHLAQSAAASISKKLRKQKQENTRCVDNEDSSDGDDDGQLESAK